MAYRNLIKAVTPGFDPRQVEAYMRMQYPTLDNLTPEHFASEARAAATCIEIGGPVLAEQVALSFGL